MKKILTAIQQYLKDGKDVVLASVIAADGSTPRGTGAKMVVLADGSTSGTIGGGAVEYAATQQAVAVHQSREPVARGYDLSANDRANLGMICGGQTTVYYQYFSAADPEAVAMFDQAASVAGQDVDAWLVSEIADGGVAATGIYIDGEMRFGDIDPRAIEEYCGPQSVLTKGNPAYYVEPIARKGRVYVFGGGHVSQALVPELSRVEFSCVVFEERERFLTQECFPDAVERIHGDFKDIGRKVSIGPSDYVVIMTRGHMADYEVVEQALATPATYVGLIGSHRKFGTTVDRLHVAGFDDTDIARIHNPIGLDILAETPAEIAVSVAAEMIRHRAEHRRRA